eukprot:GFKZ01012324.1.p1 GENE.GFKZ01012324.1~~GFKZ01012324.1.p1  ORF type:complete len:1005 (-),score=175.53 GFKZ01012324.1:1503-4403(-)
MARTPEILTHEEQVTRTPYLLKPWLSYISHLSNPRHSTLFQIYERAVAALPGSYKLWRQYSAAFREFALAHHPLHPSRDASLNVSFRAAESLRVSPVLWSEVVSDLLREGRFGRARQVANEALRLLPALQHHFVWDVLLEGTVYVENAPAEMAVCLLRRYAKYRPGGAERLFAFLVKAERWDEAIVEMVAVLRDPDWEPEGEKTREMLWMEVARVAAANLRDISTVDVAGLLRGAIRAAVTDVGELWVVLGEYFIRKGLFEEARNVYEEAMGKVNAVRDFALIFEAYAKFEEGLVSAAMEDVEVVQEEGGGENELREVKDMVELLIARLEYLTDRRPMLLSDVWLRQNPHNVHEWHKRARLFKQAKDPPNVVDTYTKAVQTVNPRRATNGRPHTLWLAFARYYEDAKDLTSARRVLDKAVSNPEGFRSAEDLAAVWCEYAEMELRCTTPETARKVLSRAVQQPEKLKENEAKKLRGQTGSNVEAALGLGAGNVHISHEYDNSSPAWYAYKSLRVWHFLLDITQSIGSPEEVIELHHRMFELRIASPQTILSGTTYLESKRLFEQAFRLYDKGTSALSWPSALRVWVVYLTRFVQRYGDSKLERARDLFEEAIRSAPPRRRGGHEYPHPQLALLFLMYADMEENHSLARHSLAVLSRATKEVREEDRASVYRVYIVKMATLFGVTKTRTIYEEALGALSKPEEVLEFAERFASMEARLGELERARGIYKHASEVADPRRRGMFEMFWHSWSSFELEHGTEDTFRDMLRQKKMVQLNHRGALLDEGPSEGSEGKGIRYMIRDTEVLNGGSGDGGNGERPGVKRKERDGQSNLDVRNEDRDEREDEIGREDHGNGSSGTLPEGSNGKVSQETAGQNDGVDMKSEDPQEATGGRPNNKLNIIQKEMPEALRKLVGAAHAQSAKKRRLEDGVDGTGKGPGKEVCDGQHETDDVERPMGALERIKRSKLNAT